MHRLFCRNHGLGGQLAVCKLVSLAQTLGLENSLHHRRRRQTARVRRQSLIELIPIAEKVGKDLVVLQSRAHRKIAAVCIAPEGVGFQSNRCFRAREHNKLIAHRGKAFDLRASLLLLLAVSAEQLSKSCRSALAVRFAHPSILHFRPIRGIPIDWWVVARAAKDPERHSYKQRHHLLTGEAIPAAHAMQCECELPLE
eukprot:2629631-Prymnesium_polylepis.4